MINNELSIIFLSADDQWRILLVIFRVFDDAIDVDSDHDVHVDYGWHHRVRHLLKAGEVGCVFEVLIAQPDHDDWHHDDQESCEEEVFHNLEGSEGKAEPM